jgi:holo-[acyl-carrier protein] synthase
MDASVTLRRTVAEFFEVDEGQVSPAFSLQGRSGSIARAALDAAIRRRVGLTSRAVYSARTFAELLEEVAPGSTAGAGAAGESPAPQAPAPIISTPSSGGVSCGVDLELVASLPETADPWEHPFYQAHFTPGEVAYCLRQAEPAHHFAARWCAKEALKKCDPAFLAVDFREIEVVADASGAPKLAYQAKPLPHALSLSHTPHAAVAMVVRVDAIPPPVSDPAPVIMPAPVAPMMSLPAPARGRKLLWLLNLAALALAALALWRTLPNWTGRWPFGG